MLEGLEPLRMRLAERLLDLLRGPRVGETLDAVRVRVLRRGEASFRKPEVASHVVEGLLRHLPVPLFPGDEPGVEVRGREEGVVVEHLLEVRDEPGFVHGVAVEPAAEDVVHAARGHSVEGRPHHRERVVAPGSQQELEVRRRRELRRAPEAAVLGVELRAKRRNGVHDQLRCERLVGRRALARLADRAHERVGLLLELAAPLLVGLRHGQKELREARHVEARLRREVRASVERPPVRREEDGHRPAAVAGHGDDRLHVQPVHVRALLPVDLHRDEALVHEPRRLFVLEGLVLHDVAPVAGRIADREQDRLVLGAGALERVIPPRVPVDGVVGVLEEVGAGLLGEPVH